MADTEADTEREDGVRSERESSPDRRAPVRSRRRVPVEAVIWLAIGLLAVWFLVRACFELT